MFKLESIAGTELTSYVVQLLDKRGVSSVRAFLDMEVNKLTKITNLSEPILIELKNKLREKFGPKHSQLSNYYEEVWKKRWKFYGTGIESLDELLGTETFATGSVWEICGIPDIGKTQFCHTLTVNFALAHNSDVLYVDTKGDFSGRRVNELLRSRNVNEKEIERVMRNIKVSRALSAKGVIQVLKQLLTQLETGDADAAAIKLVIVDALPAVWLQFRGNDELELGKHLLTSFANSMNKLAKEYFISFLVVNLLLTKEEPITENSFQRAAEEDNEIDVKMFAHGELKLPTYLALGSYWSSVPRLRLALERPDGEANRQSNARILKVLKSCYTPSNLHCCVSITDAGIVSLTG